MLIRYIFRNQFFNYVYNILLDKRCLISFRRYPRCTVRSPMTITKYFTLASLNFMYAVKAENISGYKKVSEELPTSESAISQSDEFFSIGRFRESLKILEPYEDSENVEILWRISRTLYNMSKEKGINKTERAELIKRAYNYIEKALILDKNNFAVHKWMAILYDAKSALNGMKERISALPVFKEHLMTAIELNPKDATSIYMLGQYMYSLADMSWFQKTIASTLFGTPPEATFEEAFFYFNKAEEVEPNFYSANLLMLGKTCLKLKKIETARYWLKCAIAYPVRTDEDETVRREAEELLKKYPGVKHSEKKTDAKNVH